MISIDGLKTLYQEKIQIDGIWVVARPMIKDSFKYRLKDAIQVLKGKAIAVNFYKQ